MNKQGFSLFELIVIVAIMSVLLGVAMPQLSKYYKQYKVEDEIETLYSQLMEQRFKSMNSGIPHGVRFDSQNQYTLFEFDDKNYNLKFDDVNEEKNPSAVSVSYPLVRSNPNSNYQVIIFDRDGIARLKNWSDGKLSVYENTNGINARYDCVAIYPSRIKLGVWDGSACKVK